MLKLFCLLSLTLYTQISYCANKSAHAIAQAKQEIAQFFKNSSERDKHLFAQYITYYRSEGGYQAVTPAPLVLRESLSPDARNLWEKLKQIAQKNKKFIQKPLGLPGSSKLTPEGEKYYQDLVAYTNDLLRPVSARI